jgi:hypothetical protein
MARVGLELTIPVFEWAKRVYALPLRSAARLPQLVKYGHETENDSAGGDQQQFTRQPDRPSSTFPGCLIPKMLVALLIPFLQVNEIHVL